MKKIDVYYSGWGEHWKLGQLAADGREILFEYTPEALHQGLELSPFHLKLASNVYRNFPDHQLHLPGLIADSLPDGWGLYLMDKLFRKQGIPIEEISPLDRLSFLGNRALGALCFEPALPQSLEPQDLTILEIAKEVHKLVEGDASTVLPQLAIMGGSPQGARPKIVVNYDLKSKKISTSPSLVENPWLIKFPAARENNEVCAIEFLYAQLAKEAGLEMVETDYFDLGKNFSAFGMRRFDRVNGLRVPVHTLAGVLNANFRIPSSVDYLSFLRLTHLLTKDERETLMAFRQCVFNVVFHNRDDHSKNFSFLLDQKRNWKLTPSYDLTYSTGPGGEHQMDICGEGKNPGRSHLLTLAEKSNLNKKTCEQIIDQTITVAQKFKLEAKNRPIRKIKVQEIDHAIQNMIKRLGR